MSTGRKVTETDVCDKYFPAMLQKVIGGRCCVPGCTNETQLVFYAVSRMDKPHYCDFHQENGEDTHTGEYIEIENARYPRWSCCETTWKKCACRVLSDRFRYRPEIPITDAQEEHADEKEKAATLRAEENSRQERLINSGYEESYDRS